MRKVRAAFGGACLLAGAYVGGFEVAERLSANEISSANTELVDAQQQLEAVEQLVPNEPGNSIDVGETEVEPERYRAFLEEYETPLDQQSVIRKADGSVYVEIELDAGEQVIDDKKYTGAEGILFQEKEKVDAAAAQLRSMEQDLNENRFYAGAIGGLGLLAAGMIGWDIAAGYQKKREKNGPGRKWPNLNQKFNEFTNIGKGSDTPLPEDSSAQPEPVDKK